MHWLQQLMSSVEDRGKGQVAMVSGTADVGSRQDEAGLRRAEEVPRGQLVATRNADGISQGHVRH